MTQFFVIKNSEKSVELVRELMPICYDEIEHSGIGPLAPGDLSALLAMSCRGVHDILTRNSSRSMPEFLAMCDGLIYLSLAFKHQLTLLHEANGFSNN